MLAAMAERSGGEREQERGESGGALWPQVRALPPALVVAGPVALAAAAAGAGAARGNGLEAVVQWNEIAEGGWLAVTALLSAGLFELSRRLEGTGRRCAEAAGGLLGMQVCWLLLMPVLVALCGAAPDSTLQRWSTQLPALLDGGAAVLAVVAVGGWRRAPVASAVAILAVVARPEVPGLGDALAAALPDGGLLQALFAPTLALGGTLALLWLSAVGARGRPSTIAVPEAAVSGLHIAAVGTWIRCGATLLVPLVLAHSVMGGVPLLRELERVLPIALAAVMVLAAAGLLRLAGSRVEGLPALRLASGAAAILWWAGSEAARQSWGADLIEVAVGDGSPWLLAGPLAAILGLATAGSAIAAWFAPTHPRLHQSARVRTGLFVGLSLASIVVQLAVTMPGGALLLGQLLRLLALGVMASLFSLAAAAAALRPMLPRARLRVTAD